MAGVASSSVTERRNPVSTFPVSLRGYDVQQITIVEVDALASLTELFDLYASEYLDTPIKTQGMVQFPYTFYDHCAAIGLDGGQTQELKSWIRRITNLWKRLPPRGGARVERPRPGELQVFRTERFDLMGSRENRHHGSAHDQTREWLRREMKVEDPILWMATRPLH